MLTGQSAIMDMHYTPFKKPVDFFTFSYIQEFKFQGICFNVENENVARGMLAIFNMENNNGENVKNGQWVH